MNLLNEANNIIKTVKRYQREIEEMSDMLRLESNRAFFGKESSFNVAYHRWENEYAHMADNFSTFPEVIMFSDKIDAVNKMIAGWKQIFTAEKWAELTAI